ncbi:MAG: Fic family protein [Candidatus Margulisbacteria bacterium]|jgi:cell filamentation protein|nr:Fic family protein [Candidatus Margulisiibacteriota bacterium]
MPDSYEYIDLESVYTDSKSGVLRNLGGITDNQDLLFFESVAVTKRLKESYASPLKIKNSATLLSIHKYLFQDVYEWAGKVRIVEISKAGKQFLPTSAFDTGFAYVDKLLVEYRKIDKKDLPAIASKLAEILDNINYLHPFREGTGRVQREFLRVLAMEKSITLNLNPPDNLKIYKQYMRGTIEGNVKQLTTLILDCLKNKPAKQTR